MRLRRWYWKLRVGSLLFVDSVCGQQAPLARAQDLLKAGKGQDALPILLELHRSAPLDANLCQQIGIAYTQVENLGEAENFYREATRLNPRLGGAQESGDRALVPRSQGGV
jgi:predicted Zn-dependent protease